MTDDEIRYRGFLVIWKVQRQNQSEYYFAAEKCIKQYINGELTKDQIAIIYPKGIDVLIEEQKKLNLEMLVVAILATSDNRFARAKRLNPRKVGELRRVRHKTTIDDPILGLI